MSNMVSYSASLISSRDSWHRRRSKPPCLRACDPPWEVSFAVPDNDGRQSRWPGKQDNSRILSAASMNRQQSSMTSLLAPTRAALPYFFKNNIDSHPDFWLGYALVP